MENKKQKIQRLKSAIYVGTVAAVLFLVLATVFLPKECEHQWENGICTRCKAVCEHQEGYLNGKCIICGYQCPHDVFRDGVCTTCGMVCEHPSITDGQCNVCGFICRHEVYKDGKCTVCGLACEHPGYERGRCIVCGYQCPHPDFENSVCVVCGSRCAHKKGWTEKGTCKICGAKCTHGEYKNGTCLLCGYECPHRVWKGDTCQECGIRCIHPQWENGVCKVCGIGCEHEHFTNGTCDTCGFVCNHPSHLQNHKCSLCGKFVRHIYQNGICAVCGAELVFATGELPPEFFGEVPEKGRVEVVEYDSIRFGTGENIKKQMQVYLPYGYDVTQPYDVLCLLPGMGATEKFFFEDTHYYKTGDFHLQDMIDRAIYMGVAKPMIIVALSWCDDIDYTDPIAYKDNEQIGKEIRSVILPYMIKNYSLYAKTDDPLEMFFNRTHVGVYGLSYGALLVNQGVIPNCYDIISWYTVTSTASSSVSAAIQKIKETEAQMSLYMVGYDSGEISKEPTQTAYHTLCDTCPEAVVDGMTGIEIELYDVGHSVSLFDAMVYNTIQLFFQ